MIKKGQTVKILCGDDKGKTAAVVKVFPMQGLVLVEGVNVKKIHQKGKTQGKKGEIAATASPIHISNVILVK